MVSVVMPAFNAARTIGEAIDSVLQQTHSDLELIVVDDGSTDDTAARVESIPDPRITFLSAPHVGPAAARNRAIRAATGDAVAFLDADDLWLPDKIQAQLDALESNPKAGAVYGFIDQIDEDGGGRRALMRQVAEGWILETLLVWNIIGNGSNLLIRRDVLDQTGGFDETLGAVEDWDLSVRVAKRTQIACVPRVLSLYRQREQSLTAQLRLMERCYLNAAEKAFREVPEKMRRWRPLSLAVFYHYIGARAWQQGWRRAPAALVYSLKSVVYAELAHMRVGEHGYYPFASARAAQLCGRPLTAACRSLFVPRSQRRISTPAGLRAEYETTGMLRRSLPLHDASVVPDLIEDCALFQDALADLRREGATRRVPYLLTDAIRRTAFDPAIVGMVAEILGEDESWVMWGPNIREDVPNQAGCWHVDCESIRWPTVTVVVGLEGCRAANATRYVPGSHRFGVPPSPLPSAEQQAILDEARAIDPSCRRIATFEGFGDGRFYLFDAGGWHSGDPQVSQGRKLLFLHYQRASDPRIPYMKDYENGLWFDYPATYLASDGLPNQELYEVLDEPKKPGRASRLRGLSLGRLRAGRKPRR